MVDALYLDIEPVPAEPGFGLLEPEWQSLWVARLSKTMPENFNAQDAYQERAGLMAEFGRIVCIATGCFGNTREGARAFFVRGLADADEEALLTRWVQTVDKFHARYPAFRFVGHNIREFDIPYICRRLLALGIPLPKYLQINGLKPWELNIVDTMHQWRFGDSRHFISLNLLAKVLNVPSPKDDIDGSQVRQVFYEQGDLERIRSYCAKDVVTVARIMQRLRGEKLLLDADVVHLE